MKSYTKFISSISLALVFLYSGTVAADNDDNGNRGGHGHKYKIEYNDGHHDGKKHKKKKHKKHAESVYFGDTDKIVIREYLARQYSNCPPGLAKKHNGCLPPGIAKKHYVIGQPFGGTWQELPYELQGSLHEVPIGYRYVMVDKDVLLISEASKKVIDAVTLLSAVGK